MTEIQAAEMLEHTEAIYMTLAALAGFVVGYVLLAVTGLLPK